MYISSSRTAVDWFEIRDSLTSGTNIDAWTDVIEHFLHDRLFTRYIDPIESIRIRGGSKGEGFAIVTIQCALMEFLESSAQGKNYRFARRGDPPLSANEYTGSREMFTSFLSKRQPFNAIFDEILAGDFYEGVRCALLHEACTKGGWTIQKRSENGVPVSSQTKVLFRDNLHESLLSYIQNYEGALLRSAELQLAFVRKFDALAR